MGVSGSFRGGQATTDAADSFLDQETRQLLTPSPVRNSIVTVMLLNAATNRVHVEGAAPSSDSGAASFPLTEILWLEHNHREFARRPHRPLRVSAGSPLFDRKKKVSHL
jgi:hypothetical protein